MKDSLLVACLALAALTACSAVPPADPSKMTAEQLTAVAKDKNANVSCAVLNSPWGKGVATYVTLDKAVIVSGTVSVDAECKVTITSAPAPVAASASAAK